MLYSKLTCKKITIDNNIKRISDDFIFELNNYVLQNIYKLLNQVIEIMSISSKNTIYPEDLFAALKIFQNKRIFAKMDKYPYSNKKSLEKIIRSKLKEDKLTTRLGSNTVETFQKIIEYDLCYLLQNISLFLCNVINKSTLTGTIFKESLKFLSLTNKHGVLVFS